MSEDITTGQSSQVTNVSLNNDQISNVENTIETSTSDEKPLESVTNSEPIQEKETENEAKVDTEVEVQVIPETKVNQPIKVEEPKLESEFSKPEKKKKLSLQERLALAAQKKSEKSKAKKKPKSDEIPVEKSIDFQSINQKNNVPDKIEITNTQLKPNVISEIDLNSLIPDILIDDQREDFVSKLEKYISDKINDLSLTYSTKISKLEDELKIKSKPITASANDNNLLKKIQDKELQIESLLEEGTKLSKKELLLNQSIKKLKQRETELEEDVEHNEKTIDELTNKVEILEKKVVDFDNNERALVEEKLALQTLRTKYDSLVRANDSLTDELKEIKFSKLDVQLEKALKELDEKSKFIEELSEKFEKLESSSNQLNDEKQSTIIELENQLRIEKTKVIDISRESKGEIKRLGEKIEALRFQNESSIPSEKSSDDTELIQLQYDQAQENWKIIESSYLKKISDYEIQIEELRNSNIVYSRKIKVLTNDLKQKSTSTQELQVNEETLINEIESLKKKNTLLTNTNENLVENLKHLKEEFIKEKESFEKKINTLEEVKEELESTIKLRSNDFNSSQMISQNSFYLQDISSSSSLNHLKNSNNSMIGRSASNTRYPIGFGESATTPRNSSFSLYKLNNMGSMSAQDKILRHQNSIATIDSNQNNTDQLIQSASSNEFNSNGLNLNVSGHTPYMTDSASFRNSSQDFLINDEIPMGMEAIESEHVSTINGSNNNNNNSNSGGGLNIQLIKKLSAHVRMLELEVNTLKDETKTLETEKESASEEILRLIEDNSQVQNIRDEMKLKQDETDKIQKNYQRVLVLLGEKEERVGELTADVEDLKDMLRQQVQQMVDMQEKINSLASK
ncbi:hypothetical protein C6P40_002438 [Pichia californica]|uniref:TATA element modulatory factor 1 TATA binding domain-containing protein n=1 Tax=Pichia californica TaxID=460514 RepID=A0A9P6WQS8_9ASCO|nr:hypothetical protein C6P40_002438 [[Candida] californica]